LALSYNQQTLSKLEALLKDFGWSIRYEKGNFQSGSCLVRNIKTIVLNKFVPLEQKVQSLVEIILELELEVGVLDRKQIQLISEVKKYKSST